jgi:hypothetical protein
MDPSPDDQVYTIDWSANEKVVVRAESTTAPSGFRRRHRRREHRDFASNRAALGITPITYTLSAGVGDVGLRGLQLARINSLELGLLKLRNVPCLIKDPPLRDLPVKEAESLSPLSLGFSMVIDYKTKKISFGKHLPEEASDFKLRFACRLRPFEGRSMVHPPISLSTRAAR